MARRSNGKDKGLRLILGVILFLIGISGFGMMSMMGGYFGYGMFGFYGWLISVAVLVLAVYLIYDGLKD